MNPVLAEIIKTRTVTNGQERFPLHSEMDETEGALITRIFKDVRPSSSLEIGFAYGISTLYACEALATNGGAARHVVLDPSQNTKPWSGVGLRNVREAGYGHLVEFREEPSELGLPKLLAEGFRTQVAIIDGWHTFDHALLDFFYVNRMLDVGGVLILDDTSWPAVAHVAEHILTYPAYELYEPASSHGSLPGRVRRSFAKRLKAQNLRRPYDYPPCMAFRKVAEDQRRWDWYAAF